MGDDRSKRGFRDRRRVSADADYEVHFSEQVYAQRVRVPITRDGNSLVTREREAKALKGR
jgi:hypothetical protein